jgi:fimbrial chaperone protein
MRRGALGTLMLARLTACTVAIAGFCLSSAADAARVSPMIVDLKPSGNGSVARVELTNDAARDIPFEVRVMHGEISEQGELTLTPADDDFLVFPAQAIVHSNTQQVFRLQYVGDPDLARSDIYYMSIQQVPVQIEPTQSQVQVVVNYNVLVNVVPDGTSAEAVVESVEAALLEPEVPDEADASAQPVASQPAQPGVRVRLGNKGTRLFLAGSSKWTISGTTDAGAAYSRTYQAQEMTRVIGVGVVAPDRVRSFFVPTEAPLVQDSIRVEVNP